MIEPTVNAAPVKINNNEQFAKYLADYPPQYNLGDAVSFKITENGNVQIGTVSGRTFREREKTWKYTCKLNATNFNVETYSVIGNHTLP